MEICYLPIKSLYKNPDNFFKPLKKKEYGELKDSIRKFGIIEPLIVTSTDPGRYMILAGNNRYDIAQEFGFSVLQCIIVDRAEMEGAFDTEIFRRHLTEEERDKYISIKEKKCKELIDNVLKERLLPEIYEDYKEGKISLNSAIILSKTPLEEQAILFQKDDKDEPEGISLYKRLLEKKEEELEKKEKELEVLKKWKEEKKEELEENIEKYKGMEEKVTEKIRKEFEKSIKNINEVNEKLRSQINKKEQEIAELKENIESIRNQRIAEEVQKKAEVVEELETLRKYMVNVIVINLRNALEYIKKSKNLLKDPLNRRDFEEARKLLNEITELSREMISTLKVKERKNEETS
jgi:ParB family chromosome partitioning protein